MSTLPLRVLVADDDATTRFLARTVLEAAGFTVEEAGNGREALARFREAPCDLVLMDGLMPELDGFAACAAIRALPEGRRTIVLMLSGLEDEDSLERALAAGAYDFLRKPLDFAGLPRRLRMIGSRRPVEEAPPREGHADAVEQLERLLARARRGSRRVAVLALGQEASGSVATDPQTLRHRLQAALRTEDLVREESAAGSLDSDLQLCPVPENIWWMLLTEVRDVEDAARVAERVQARLGADSGSPPQAGTTYPIGYSFFPEDGEDAVSLMERARTALQSARSSHVPMRACHPVREALARERLSLARDLEQAIAEGSLELRAHPVLAAGGGVQAWRMAVARRAAQWDGLVGEDGQDLLRDLRLEGPLALHLLDRVADWLPSARESHPGRMFSLPVPQAFVEEPALLERLARLSRQPGGLEGLELEVLPGTAAFTPANLDLLGHWPGLRLALSSSLITLDMDAVEALKRLPIGCLVVRGDRLGPSSPPRLVRTLEFLAAWAHELDWKLRVVNLREPGAAELARQAGCDELEGPALGEDGSPVHPEAVNAAQDGGSQS